MMWATAAQAEALVRAGHTVRTIGTDCGLKPAAAATLVRNLRDSDPSLPRGRWIAAPVYRPCPGCGGSGFVAADVCPACNGIGTVLREVV